MPWTLVEKRCTTRHPLQQDRAYAILLQRGLKELLVVALEDETNKAVALGRIEVLPAGIKLEAVNDDLHIIQPLAKSPEGYYRLNKRQEGRSEIMFLRENDTIRLSNLIIRLVSDPVEIQVNSSVTGEEGAEVPESDDQPAKEPVSNVQSREELEDTEDDDEDLDITPENRPSPPGPTRSRVTPDPSIPRTEVVQETPTVNRLFHAPEADMGFRLPTLDHIELTPPLAADLPPSGPEMFSTAPMKPDENKAMEVVVRDSDHASSGNAEEPKPILQKGDNTSMTSTQKANQKTTKEPQVRLSRTKTSSKRSSTMGRAEKEDEDEDPPQRPAKRAKIEKNSSVVAPTPTRKTRSNTPADPASAAVASQASAEDDALYGGSEPMVAFSNSEIHDGSHFLKFLVKHGGRKVKSVNDDECNVLCVRDGPLKKSMKLLLCIALGIPIVTDEWLMDSAKQGKLLALDAYSPSVPDQEKEWNTSLDTVLGKKQDTLFNGYIVYFTPALKKVYHPFSEAQDVCTAAGAVKAVSKVTKELNPGNTIVLANDEDDDAVALAEKGFRCYTKDLLTLSILRGELDLDSNEFKITPRNSQPKKKGRPRKS